MSMLRKTKNGVERPSRGVGVPVRALSLAILILFAGSLSSCVYYNTFYLAKKNYYRSLDEVPYPVDKTDITQQPQFAKSIEYSKKVVQSYPKSKWVDDAYLLWARGLIANDDPRQAAKMLEEFPTKFPKSGLRDEAQFYLGVAYRQARKNERAVATLDAYLADKPKSDLAPFANFERARAFMSLDRPQEAADAASATLDRVKKGTLPDRARLVRADALLEMKAFDRARADYKTLGARAPTDDDRLTYLLRESECIEGAHEYDDALRLLRDALAHERPPMVSDTTGGRQAMVQTVPGYDRYGRILTRIGTVQLMSGDLDGALASYRKVVQLYPRAPIAGEAQYRIGYGYETVGDDFEKARAEYARVRDVGMGTTYADQAQRRATNLDRLAQFRSSVGDSVNKKAEAGFLLAEQYLFQLDKPERAYEEYGKVAVAMEGTPYEAKAMTAQAWVLENRLNRKASADSLWWEVVREHPATEAQLAARDYLERDGETVPDHLIKLPEAPLAVVDTVRLTPPPEGSMPLGAPPTGLGIPGAPTTSLESLGPSSSPPPMPTHAAPPPPPLPPPPAAVAIRPSAGAADTVNTMRPSPGAPSNAPMSQKPPAASSAPDTTGKRP
jgi:TolA-binding protein